MATFGIVSTKTKVSIKTEFRNFPLTFVNGMRRILLSGLPTVVVRDVQILDNTTQMPHEMMKHRMELLPINVLHTDTGIIRDTVIELRLLPQTDDSTITTDDFAVLSGRENVIMRDRDLDTPLLYLRVKKGESVHIKAKLAVELGSQVCTASMSYHIDPERAEKDKAAYIEKGGDPRVFDNFYIQKSYSIDDIGRPNWIDLAVESVGVVTPKDTLKLALTKLKADVDSWMTNALENVTHEKEANVYHIKLDQGGHTIGALLQEVMYHSKDVSFVSYDIPHPLKPAMVLRFVTEKAPELLLKNTLSTIHEYCGIVEKGL
jgi:DNA-directed RNA polymerase subunit L